MLDKTHMLFSHVKPGDTNFAATDCVIFFKYRDLGIAEATRGKVLAQIVIANSRTGKGHGVALSWRGFPYRVHVEGLGEVHVAKIKETLVAAGDCGAPAPRHSALISSTIRRTWNIWKSFGPADFTAVDIEGPCAVPAPKPW